MGERQRLRRDFADVVADRAGCAQSAVHKAFLHVDRYDFVGAGPWYFSEDAGPSETNDPALIYRDVVIALARDRGITNGLPSLHACCMAACNPAPGEHVIHVGAGSGYYTAILADLVGPSGRVKAFEVDADLASAADRNLAHWPWVDVESVSPIGSELGSADIIYVCAGVEEIPLAWLKALRPGGRLMFPLTPLHDEGAILLVEHVGSSEVFSARYICSARFVPCEGALDSDATARLREAFATGAVEKVRSLRLSPAGSDDRTWFAGKGWRLSAEPPG